MKKVTSFILIICAMTILVGCGANPNRNTTLNSTLALHLPEGWTSTPGFVESNPIAVSNESQTAHILTFEEPASDFEEGYNLDNYVTDTMETILSALTDSKINNQTQLTLTDLNLVAHQFEISGFTSQMEIAYLVTFFENNGIFYQILAWSTPEDFTVHSPTFKEITSSITFAD